MNVLPRQKRIAVLGALLVGASERRVAVLTGVNRGTINRLALEFGEAAVRLHDGVVRDVVVHQLMFDELWAWWGCKPSRADYEPTDEDDQGGAWLYSALAKESRMLVGFKVGPRNKAVTKAFALDVRARLAVMPQITTDGWSAYVEAVREAFGESVSYLQVIKSYRTGSYGGPDHRYEPPRDAFLSKRVIFGAPDMNETTSLLERNNGTLRGWVSRIRRLTYAFSKAERQHAANIALGIVHYNFCHIPRTIRVTPAMAQGVTREPWDIEMLYDALMSARQAEPLVAKPLVHPKPDVTSRELPGGRGFLRVVDGGGEPSAPASPSPPTTPAQVQPKQLGLFTEDPEEPS